MAVIIISHQKNYFDQCDEVMKLLIKTTKSKMKIFL